ncbi:hypothetical protein AMTR_s00063p00136490 [Amborella trichopoda]|uniref:Uncharacterized protein n=1 Tax=Amborella trichopoda TaxID=13333 RepID=U5D1Y4_AMBTC|nr:hypothetical protein AMTR_s00063p00136490 [Amborella trichopoda]
MGGAALLHRVAKSAEGLVKRWMDRPVGEACQTGPLLDVVLLFSFVSVASSVRSSSNQVSIFGEIVAL